MKKLIFLGSIIIIISILFGKWLDKAIDISFV